MELKEFIEQTLIQITDGVQAGHRYIKENSKGEGVDGSTNREVKFDIAIATNEEEKSGIGGKLTVANILSVGGKDESTIKSSNVSRINFSLFVHVS